jgi:hypothetical protein
VQKNVSTQTFVAAIAAAVVVVAGIMWWVYRSPTAQPESGQPRKVAGPGDHGPTPDDLRKIQEWKKTHPNAITDNR